MTLPQPIGRQREVLALPARGHHVVLGSAGSGKTTMAVHRALFLAHPNTDHHGRTLLVTFNRCLVAYLQSLTDNIPRQVEVRNYHHFARGYLNSRGRMRYNAIAGPERQATLCRDAVSALRAAPGAPPILDAPTEFLVEEFRWLAQHGISSLAEYDEAERVGRSGARVTRRDRPWIWALYEQYLQLRADAGLLYDWDDLARAACEEFAQDAADRHYRHVVIDEGQDFSPMMVRSLASAVPPDGSLTFFGDMAQQIYGNRISWRSAGLTVRQVWQFQENYRNTRQVSALALAVAASPFFTNDPDLVAPRAPSADGPLPALVTFGSERDELAFVASRAQRLAASGTVAILLRDRDEEAALARLLPNGATRLHRELTTWPTGPGVFYGTYHAAKGLEFDAVFLPRLSAGRLPHPPDVEAFGEDDARRHDASLLYVGITRARSTLVLSYAGSAVTPLLPSAPGLYQRSDR